MGKKRGRPSIKVNELEEEATVYIPIEQQEPGHEFENTVKEEKVQPILSETYQVGWQVVTESQLKQYQKDGVLLGYNPATKQALLNV